MRIWKISQSSIIAYHGTCEGLYNMILEDDGLKNPYLARDIDLAKYYAKEASVNYRCGNPIVLEVMVPCTSNLRYDKYSMSDPVYANVSDVDKSLEQIAKSHPEWVEYGVLVIPESEWKISWDIAGAARYNGVITEEYFTIL